MAFPWYYQAANAAGIWQIEELPTSTKSSGRTVHVDRVKAHQVTWPNNGRRFAVGLSVDLPSIMHFHAEVDGRWTLMLVVDEDELLIVRNVSQLGEQRP
jgi:hypothetical protein